MAEKSSTRRKKKRTAAADPDGHKADRPMPLYRPFANIQKQVARTEVAKPRDGSGAPPEGGRSLASKRADSEISQRPSNAAPRAPAAQGRADGPSDADTFAMFMAGVRELEGQATRIPKTASRVERAARGSATVDADAPALRQLGSLVSEGIRFEVTDDGAELRGRRVETPPRELRRLASGAYAIDGKLDLHGLTAEQARPAVETFVRKRRTEGDRVVMIVHGRGSHSPGGLSVLRGEIAAWLTEGRAARDVLAFTSTAPSNDAGPASSGAVVVLLAR